MPLKPPKTWRLSKEGNRPEECEDAFRVVYPSGAGAEIVRAAVCDGATESAFAREWAEILADAFVDQPLDLSGMTEGSLKTWLKRGQEEWHEGIPWDQIPWHGEAKARAGAFATLLGLTIGADLANPRQPWWQAVAVGDSCLFVVRNDRLLLSFPLEDAGQFDNNPALVCSNPANSQGLWEGVRLQSGECSPGDRFILASDALAAWFLASYAAGEKPWETLLELDASERDAWVGEQRSERLMRNDDTTLVIIDTDQVPKVE
jgi:hypothetical protein